MAHFYLGDACRRLKAWACAEEHYETSLELDAQSSVAGLAKQRGRKAKVWRMLEEGKQAINEPKTLPEKVAQAKDTLDIANKLGLDDEQQAFYQQLQEKIQQGHKQSHEKTASAQTQEMPMALVSAGEFIMGSQGGLQTNNRRTGSMWMPFSWTNTKCRWGSMRSFWKPRHWKHRQTGTS